MPKKGIVNDYDLMANQEKSAHGQKCRICDAEPVVFQWSDYSGEAMCHRCGCPYQLKWGSDQQRTDGKYPYLNLKEDFIPAAREYWAETQKFVCYGWMLGARQGVAELTAWLKEKHPQCL